jgi:translocation and assembly module TamB
MSVLGPRTAFDLELLRKVDNDDWGVTVHKLTSAAITARGNGNISPATARTDGMLEVETVDNRRLAKLAEPVVFSSAAAKIGFSGPLTHPVIQLETMIDDLAVEGFAAARTNLQAELRPDGPLDTGDSRISMNGEVQFNRLKTPSPELSGLLGENPDLAFADARLDRFTQLNIGEVTVSGAKAGVSLGGDIALDSGVLDATGQVTISELASLSEAAGRAVAGGVRAAFVLARKVDGAIDLTVDGVLRDASLEQPLVERLLGSSAHFAGTVQRQPDGLLSLSDLVLSGEGLEARGRLSLQPDANLLEADYDIAISDLGALGIEDPDRAGGTLGVTGKAAGPAANPAIDGRLRLVAAAPGGFPVKRLETQYAVSNVATAPRGEIHMTGEIDLLPDLSGQIGFMLTENLLTLRRLNLSARGTSVEGVLSIPLDGQAVAGNLVVRAPDIEPWSAVAGRTLAGKLDAKVGLLGAGNKQDTVLDATLTNFAIDDLLSSRRIKLEMRIADISGVPRLKGSVVAGDSRSGAAEIAELTLGLDGAMRDLQYRIHASGNVGDRDLSLDANGQLRKTGESTTLAVSSLAGKAAGIPVGLRKPALLEFDPTIDSGDIDMAVGDGTIRGRYRQADGGVSMEVDIDAIPLVSIWPTAPPQLVKSVIDAKATLGGTLGGPTGRLDLSVTGLATGETKETEEGLKLALKGELESGELTAAGRIDGLAGATAHLRMSVPARLSLAPAVFSIDEHAPLTASLTYAGPVGSSWALLGLDRHRLEGQGDVALELSGTLDDPRISGRVEMVHGLYENLDTGTILSDIQVSARPSNSSMAIDRFVAKDGGEGEISVSGGIDFGGGELTAMDLRVGFRKARLIRRDELNAVASGQLTLRGGASGNDISGRLEVDEAEIMLVSGLPPGVVEIPVEEKGTPPAGAVEAQARVRRSQTDLNIEVSIPRRVFVRGHGLDSEWGGDLRITGTTALPRIQGELRPLRGRYDFAGKIFNLRNGTITFAGGDEIDPILDISAERETTDLTAIIHVTGTATKPSVALESIPEQPQDEILGRVLFNKSTGRLTATEALQLAQAVRMLTGASGGGIMNSARDTLNLDVLRFPGESQEGASGAEVGKYLSDGIYVGAEGSAAGETGVTVEIEITPGLKLESDVGKNDNNQIGLKWKRDY